MATTDGKKRSRRVSKRGRVGEGRPSGYSNDMADSICAGLAEGKSLITCCAELGISVRAVYGWLREHSEFVQAYTRAREDQAHTLADDMLRIADEDPATLVESSKDGKEDQVIRVDSAAVNHQRLRVDTRKWIASKLLPKKYGDSQRIEHSGPEGGPIQLGQSREQLIAQIVAFCQQNPMVKHKLRETLQCALRALE